MKEITRSQLYTSRIGAITRAKACYLVYSVKGFCIGKIARNLESDLAFETEDWDFFSKDFKVEK